MSQNTPAPKSATEDNRGEGALTSFPQSRVDFHRVLLAVSQAFGCDPGLITGRRQTQRAARARHAFVALVQMHDPEASLVSIGQALGGRDHTTIISSSRRADELLEHDPEFRAALADAHEALQGEAG